MQSDVVCVPEPRIPHYQDLRKIVPAKRTDADRTTNTASRYNDAGAVLHKSLITLNCTLHNQQP